MQKLQQSKAEIEKATLSFYEALQYLFQGDAEPMKAVWSHASDVSYLGPQGGLIIGWEDVWECWKEQAALKLKGKVEPQGMHVFASETLGFTQNFEVGTNIIYDKEQKIHIRATNIFRLENGEWKMISHQTDLIPELS